MSRSAPAHLVFLHPDVRIHFPSLVIRTSLYAVITQLSHHQLVHRDHDGDCCMALLPELVICMMAISTLIRLLALIDICGVRHARRFVVADALDVEHVVVISAQDIAFLLKSSWLSKPSVPVPISSPSSTVLNVVWITSLRLSSATEAAKGKENCVNGGEGSVCQSRCTDQHEMFGELPTASCIWQTALADHHYPSQIPPSSGCSNVRASPLELFVDM